MIDIHSHILYGIDDGATTLDETLDMLRIAVDEGIHTIVATPHYSVDDNQYSKEHILRIYNEVTDKIRELNIPIKLLLGNELFADSMLPEKLEQGQCFTLGHSDYVLLEFPASTTKYALYNVIYQLKLKGYRPIIAHPERSFSLEYDIETVIELIDGGCLMQINTGSLTGLYGNKIQKVVLRMLEQNMIHLIATDAHSRNGRAPRMKKAYDIVKVMCSEAYADILFRENVLSILNNNHIKTEEPLELKTSNWVRSYRLNKLLKKA